MINYTILSMLYSTILIFLGLYFILWVGYAPLWINRMMIENPKSVFIMPELLMVMLVAIGTSAGIICAEIHNFIASLLVPQKKD